MDLVSKSHSIRAFSHALLPPVTSPQPQYFRVGATTTSSLHSNDTSSFPIIAIAVIGIVATAFLLVSYYIFVIKCCLNWHRIDVLRRFSRSASRAQDDLLMAYSPGREPRGGGGGGGGLDESVIRSIPILHFKRNNRLGQTIASFDDDIRFFECAVCLNEFEDNEKLRIIPNCLHVFHIDCIDVWLQNNANCPLCRTSISANRFQFNPAVAVVAPSPSPVDPGPFDDEDYVVIELSNETNNGIGDRNVVGRHREISPARKIECSKKMRSKFLSKGTSMGDECIESAREKDEVFSVQPIRRSFSMDSSADRKMFLAIQDAVRHSRQVSGSNVSPKSPIDHGSCSGGCSSCNISKVKRSFFSFSHGRGGSSRSAVLPVYLET